MVMVVIVVYWIRVYVWGLSAGCSWCCCSGWRSGVHISRLVIVMVMVIIHIHIHIRPSVDLDAINRYLVQGLHRRRGVRDNSRISHRLKDRRVNHRGWRNRVNLVRMCQWVWEDGHECARCETHGTDHGSVFAWLI